ncbi:MAG: bifunctional adenosylcobinamide kinase/adenosylcobinamide-phosphate guanylyltransferase [Neptuniibacter caesariensis]|uniref:Bifunctional adenosylcobalamin biosynthesis protein n=1 Tax=Neptuniibacter caesariensis TaxID=207954 RepID=A0A2G6JKT1_NEPCE|nr:MAG: bifunctional adenosylcobinamide kinase/adenosylcobinamide-phosphate guanylyltransferase [Neptuniibacter caesariensis]
MRQLILGGARSGKSRLAEERAKQLARPVIYIATAKVCDQEMANRVQLHQQSRPDNWELIEEPVALPQCLRRLSGDNKVVLVDCLTLWLTNLLLIDQDAMLQGMDELERAVAAFQGDLFLVSNEVGWGIVPMGELSRVFQDNTGHLHQKLAAIVESVTLCVAGIPLDIKGGVK